MNKAKQQLPRDSALMAEIGQALHGQTWKQALAKDLEVSESALYAQVTNKRTVTPAMRVKLLAFVRSQPERLSQRLVEDLALMRRIERDLVAKGDVVDEPLPTD